MNRILLAFLALITLTFTTGCTISPKYKVSIDAITATNVAVAPSSYQIKALDEKKNSEGLLFQQHSAKLAQILQQKGYTPTNQGAQQYIYFDYGLDKVNEETQTYAEPNISFHMGWGHPFGGYYGRHPFYHDFYGGGYTTYRETRSYYNRYVTLLAKDQFNKELWRVDVSSVGESKNLRKIIPMLLEAATPYLGTNTTEPVQFVIKEQAKKQ
ncbi:MAG: Unknown protein [uncultured Sulfurovum sp.]|uniref:DUF4136 domain-containing protein n=1 Tax=uncultured Sulfurovum sp. TaxID=269237 RepID=A0A6S6U3Q9_9BACT|nr:MAG: Unknown protein [uncultured Sulfurovum sp.]